MITSDQIHEKEFSYKMRGYNDAEVDAYLDQLAAFIDNLTKENKELRERLRRHFNDFDDIRYFNAVYLLADIEGQYLSYFCILRIFLASSIAF